MNSIACPVQTAARRYPAAFAVMTSKGAVSYRDFDLLISSAAIRLAECGVKPKSRVAVYAEPSAEFVILLWAIWRQGAVACPLNVRLPATAIRQQLADIQATHLVVADRPFRKIKPQKPKIISIHALVASLTNPATQKPRSKIKISLQQNASILFTSGSTQSKAAVHTFGNHYFNALGSNENIPVGTASRWLLALPLYHVSGLSILFRCALGGGAVVITGDQEDMLRIFKTYAPTHLSLVPTQLCRILKMAKGIQSLKKMSAILLGGSAIPANLTAACRKLGLPIFMTYGMTETASQVATSDYRPETRDKRRRTKNDLTKPVEQNRGLKSRVSSLKSPTNVLKYRQLKISQDGEILVKGKVLFKGYWQNGQLSRPMTKDGWFATGDLGRIDNAGNLSVSGRKDNMFISGGENIHPEEIERHLLTHPRIELAVVVPVGDREFGRRPAAFIKIAGRRKLSANTLRPFLASRLPGYKIPVRFFPWPKAKTPAGLKPSRRFFQNSANQIIKKF